MTKIVLRNTLDDKLRIFGPYEKRLYEWYLTGGAIGALLRDDIPNDYDIFFETHGAMSHVSDLIKGSMDLIQHVEESDSKYGNLIIDNKLVTTNAITMKNGLQFITRVAGSPDKVRESFDYVHCMPYYSFATNHLFISEEQYDCCMNKVLKVNNETTVTDKRKTKFIMQGFKECQ